MIVTVTPEKINIHNDQYHCTFSDETLEKLASCGLIRRRKVTYKLFINHREFQLECPLLKHSQCKNIVLWPALKLPYRKYPVHVYLYAVALYLSTNLDMRSAAAEVKKTFGLDGFSHSTLCRTLKKLRAVSYTHLDVYKRQRKGRSGPNSHDPEDQMQAGKAVHIQVSRRNADDNDALKKGRHGPG